MREETTFLPPRTSTTSSIGISTRPILSCRLKAATRLSRLSFTFFSKPEYVWMMYHCMLMDRCSSSPQDLRIQFFFLRACKNQPLNPETPSNTKPLQKISDRTCRALLHEVQIDRKK